jgi:hypothetical protein
VQAHGDWIGAEVLAAELVVADEMSASYDEMQVVEVGGITARVAISRKR